MYYPSGGTSLKRSKSKRRQSSSNPASPAELNEALMSLDIAKWFRDDIADIEDIPLEVPGHICFFRILVTYPLGGKVSLCTACTVI